MYTCDIQTIKMKHNFNRVRQVRPVIFRKHFTTKTKPLDFCNRTKPLIGEVKWTADCKETILSISTETNQNDGGLPLSPLLPSTNSILKKKKLIGVLELFDLWSFPVLQQLWQMQNQKFLLLLGARTHVSFTWCLPLVFKLFFNPSFQQPCLQFITKATVESFRAASSCGYPASHKHGGFLPRLLCYIRMNHGILHHRDPRTQSCHNSV